MTDATLSPAAAAATPPPLARAAYVLGYAGLVPPALAWRVPHLVPDTGSIVVLAAVVVGIVYPLLILSFIGGIWWGLALGGRRPGPLLAVAILPSLVALALAVSFLIAWAASSSGRSTLPIATGIALYATLPVDRWLTRRGLAPPDWMRLRVPLSLGLGTLSILFGVLP